MKRSPAFSFKTYQWRNDVNYRIHPENYRVGRGEQGVLLCEPYKSEILPYWRFRTPEMASISSAKILELFHSYLDKGDFIGADMARKFLQMGFTRARRYANYKGGRKYDPNTNNLLTRGTGEALKAESAAIFYDKWQEAEGHVNYRCLKEEWKKRFG